MSLLLPRRVAGVRERHVADTQHVHGAQGPQAAVDGVAALHADQTGRPVLAEGRHDVCGEDDGIRPGQNDEGAGG